MRAHSTTVAAAALAMMLGACNSSDAGPPIPIDDLPRLMADALCNNIGPCCQQAGFPFDAAQCHTNAENGWRTQIDRIHTANVSYDGNAARSCVNAYSALVQACQDQSQIGTACANVFVGTLPPGQTCTSSNECAPGATCRVAGDAGVSQCTSSTISQVHGKLGESCNATCTTSSSGTSTSCSGFGGQGGQGAVSCYTNDSLYCDSAHACATTPSLGQPCTTGTPCAGDAFCDNGACAAKRTSGSCGQLNDGCATAAYCDTATRQCQLRKSTGDACTSATECPTTDSCTGGTCRTRTIATASMCMGGF